MKDLLQNGRAVLSCLELLETIEGKSLNYSEIAQELEQSEETIKQKLNALIEGGISIKKERDGRFISPSLGGRPRRLCRKNKHSRMTTTKIHSAIATDKAILVVFYTTTKCWQFRVINSNGSVFGEQKIFYTPEAAQTAGRDWIQHKL